MTNRILQIGNPASPLNWGMGTAAQSKENQIYWFSPFMGNLPGVKHFALPPWIAKSYLLRAIFEPFILAYYIRKIDPDLIQVHFASKGLATIPIIMRKPLLVSTMGSDIVPGLGYKFPYRYWIDLMLANADKITTRSAFMKTRLIDMGADPQKIEVNSWGIDLDHFVRHKDSKALKQKWGLPRDAFVFFDPRSANPLYNKDIIIKAFARFRKNSPQKAVLLVAAMFASPQQLQDLKELVSDLDLNQYVHFIGSVAYEEMPELYSLAEATVSVPSSDGMPQTIFEAWACGSFLIVGDLPQYNEFIDDGINAKRVPLRDVPALADAMHWIVNNPDIRLASIVQGRERARHFADRKVQKAHLSALVNKMLPRRK